MVGSYGRQTVGGQVRAIILRVKTGANDPLVDKARILASADVGGVIDTAGKGEVVDGAAPALKPREDGGSSGFQDIELNRPRRSVAGVPEQADSAEPH